MIKCVSFESFLPEGTTRPFLSRSESGSCWVVKAAKDTLGNKVVFNEYVAGTMANAICLPWPKVNLTELSPQIIEHLKENGFALFSKYAVALEYIPGLRTVGWPERGISNAEHIRNVFPALTKHTSFYGMAVFDNWLLFEDQKYDTLHIDARGDPMFLDASMALAGPEWDKEKLQWVDTHIDIHFPYLEGILTDNSQFEPWLLQIQNMKRSLLREVFERIPSEWHVPAQYLSTCQELLEGSTEKFIPLIRQWVKWR